MGSELILGYHVTDSRNITFNQLDKLDDEGFRKIWKNKLTQTIYEEYTIFDTSNTSLQHEYDVYQKRRIQNSNLVKVFYVQNVSKEFGGTSYRELRVFTEYIPILISDMANIDLGSALYFLKKALIGYQILYKQAGFFEVLQIFMGIDTQCQPKVWLNNNWSLNKPPSKLHGTSHSIFLQGVMVQQILFLIQKMINREQISHYKNNKDKIHQWTFQVAHQFLTNYINEFQIILPGIVSYVLKPSQKIKSGKLNNLHVIKQFTAMKSLIKPNLNIDVAQDNLQSVQSPRKLFPPNITPKSSSLHYKYETHGILNFKHKNDISSPQSNNKTFVFDSRIKRSEINKDLKNIDTSSQNTSKRRSSQSNFLQFTSQKQSSHKQNSQQKQKLVDSKTGNVFLKSSKTNSFIEGQPHLISKNSIIESNKRRIETSNSQKKMKTQSAILRNHIPHFKTIKAVINLNTSEAYSSLAQKSKTSQHDSTLNDNTIKTSTVDSNGGFYSPTTRSRNPLVHNCDNKNWLVLSQQLKVPTTFEQACNKSPTTHSPYPLSNEPRQSDVITEDLQQVSDFIVSDEPKKLAKPRMTQSITINQFVQQSKKNDKPLSMLDMYISKKTIQKISHVGIRQNNNNIQLEHTNNLALSIIQPQIQESIQQEI